MWSDSCWILLNALSQKLFGKHILMLQSERLQGKHSMQNFQAMIHSKPTKTHVGNLDIISICVICQFLLKWPGIWSKFDPSRRPVECGVLSYQFGRVVKAIDLKSVRHCPCRLKHCVVDDLPHCHVLLGPKITISTISWSGSCPPWRSGDNQSPNQSYQIDQICCRE